MLAVRYGLARCLAASPSCRYPTSGEYPTSIVSLEDHIDSLTLWNKSPVIWMLIKTTSMLFITFFTCFAFFGHGVWDLFHCGIFAPTVENSFFA